MNNTRTYQIESALVKYQKALNQINSEDSPIKWAENQAELGNFYLKRMRGNNAENKEAAIACYEKALTIYNPQENTEVWTKTMLNLGNSYLKRIKNHPGENIEIAIECFQRALNQYKNRDTIWTELKCSLGNAYQQRISGDKQGNLNAAVEAYQDALRVYSLSNYPEEWAMTQQNLGDAYLQLDNKEEAIKAYETSLQVIKQANFPYQWGKIQHHLGDAYKNNLNIRTAINHYQNAQNVYTKAHFPITWAEIAKKLATCYLEIQEKRRGLESYRKVLEIQNHEAYPEEASIIEEQIKNLQQELGIIEIDFSQWKESEEVKKQIRNLGKSLNESLAAINQGLAEVSIKLNWVINAKPYNLQTAVAKGKSVISTRPSYQLTFIRKLVIAEDNYLLEVIPATQEDDSVEWLFRLSNVEKNKFIPVNWILRLLSEDEEEVYDEVIAESQSKRILEASVNLPFWKGVIWETEPKSGNYHLEILKYSQ